MSEFQPVHSENRKIQITPSLMRNLQEHYFKQVMPGRDSVNRMYCHFGLLGMAMQCVIRLCHNCYWSPELFFFNENQLKEIEHVCKSCLLKHQHINITSPLVIPKGWTNLLIIWIQTTHCFSLLQRRLAQCPVLWSMDQ